MSWLSNLLKRAARASVSERHVIPYMRLQKYFQLFVDDPYTVKENVPLDDPSVNIPGQFFADCDITEAKDFFSPETSFTATATFQNNDGGRLYHGNYITHGKDGGATEYMYIVIASPEDTDDAKLQKLTAHFLFLGGRMSGEKEEVVYPVFVQSQSEFNAHNKTATFEKSEIDNAYEIISALAYADAPFKRILEGKKIDTAQLAADFQKTSMVTRWQKFDDLATNRRPNFLTLEVSP